MQLPKVKGEYKTNYELAHLTWLRVGGPAEVFFKPLDTEDLSNFLLENQRRLQVTVLGAGSNILLRDKGIKGAVIKLGKNFTNIEFIDDKHIAVGGGCLNFNLTKFCMLHSITGFEFLAGIPGTVSGGVAMNAGAYGREFKDIISAIEVIDSDGKILTLTPEQIGFKYRGNSLAKDLIITKAIFQTTYGNQDSIIALMNEINAKRLATQPIKERTCGSTFANPESYKAWQLIESAGLKGYRIGDAAMSELHCNFMINHGKATARDLESLGEFVRQKVLEHSGIMLQWEVKRIGEH